MKKRQYIFFILFFLSGIYYWNACTSRQKYIGKKILPYFFDGAPDPDDTIKPVVQATDTISKKKPVVIRETVKLAAFVHAPFQNKQCDDCHSKIVRGQLNRPQPELCYTCHDDFRDKFAFMHGPADGGYCTSCHKPHTAQIEKLLVKNGQSLCLGCHVMSDIKKNEVHADIGETNCAECHNPHGGNDKYLLN